jgi:uncharacterized membrane-anchored protein
MSAFSASYLEGVGNNVLTPAIDTLGCPFALCIRTNYYRENSMIFVLINILIIAIVGAILFWVIDKFVRDGRLANLLKILVVLVCLLAILQRLLPALGVGLF